MTPNNHEFEPEEGAAYLQPKPNQEGQEDMDGILLCGNCGMDYFNCGCGNWNPVYVLEVVKPDEKQQEELWHEAKEIMWNHFNRYHYPAEAIAELQSKFHITKK